MCFILRRKREKEVWRKTHPRPRHVGFGDLSPLFSRIRKMLGGRQLEKVRLLYREHNAVHGQSRQISPCEQCQGDGRWVRFLNPRHSRSLLISVQNTATSSRVSPAGEWRSLERRSREAVCDESFMACKGDKGQAIKTWILSFQA